ncbi:phytanoyl-CoA dioxygenase family protein [Streptomyces sp. NPDC096013]|uniref:phytanoyl-CoA dioxygenase family protein n=1 Tax=Streptomyces sp. NPDC096013 TaxID=3366069 RepID=UPI0038062FC5
MREGFLEMRGLVDPDRAGILAETVSRLAEGESGDPAAEVLPGQNIYIRFLLDKDVSFHPLLMLEPALSLARSVLGPQVWIDLDARMTYPKAAGYAVPWHIHMPVVPQPAPVFFCYPHQIHCLIYLDPVGTQEGPLCLIPGSHTAADFTIPPGDHTDREGQVELRFQPGDAVLLHGNLWHRVRAATAAAGPRRLLLLGYVPSWIRADTDRGVKASRPLTARLRRTADQETRELLGEFSW